MLAKVGLLAALVPAFIGFGCVGVIEDGSDQEGAEVGSVDLTLSINGIDLSEVHYTITGNGIDPVAGIIPLTDQGATISALVGLPPGIGYQLQLTAESADGSVECHGLTTFDVIAGETTQVDPVLACRPVSDGGPYALHDAGGTTITVSVRHCPVLTNVPANVGGVPVGRSIQLSVAASDPDSKELSFTWTSTAGQLDSDGTDTALLECDRDGTFLVMVGVSDGDCQDFAEFEVTCVEPVTDDAGPDAAREIFDAATDVVRDANAGGWIEGTATEDPPAEPVQAVLTQGGGCGCRTPGRQLTGQGVLAAGVTLLATAFARVIGRRRRVPSSNRRSGDLSCSRRRARSSCETRRVRLR